MRWCRKSCTGLLLAAACCAGCAPLSVPAGPPGAGVAERRLPAATRVLGQAAQYVAADGRRMEIVHDPLTSGVLVKTPEGGLVMLPEEVAGTPGRYRDRRVILWETEGGAMLWNDGRLVFSGRRAGE